MDIGLIVLGEATKAEKQHAIKSLITSRLLAEKDYQLFLGQNFNEGYRNHFWLSPHPEEPVVDYGSIFSIAGNLLSTLKSAKDDKQYLGNNLAHLSLYLDEILRVCGANGINPKGHSLGIPHTEIALDVHILKIMVDALQRLQKKEGFKADAILLDIFYKDTYDKYVRYSDRLAQ